MFTMSQQRDGMFPWKMKYTHLKQSERCRPERRRRRRRRRKEPSPFFLAHNVCAQDLFLQAQPERLLFKGEMMAVGVLYGIQVVGRGWERKVGGEEEVVGWGCLHTEAGAGVIDSESRRSPAGTLIMF